MLFLFLLEKIIEEELTVLIHFLLLVKYRKIIRRDGEQLIVFGLQVLEDLSVLIDEIVIILCLGGKREAFNDHNMVLYVQQHAGHIQVG